MARYRSVDGKGRDIRGARDCDEESNSVDPSDDMVRRNGSQYPREMQTVQTQKVVIIVKIVASR